MLRCSNVRHLVLFAQLVFAGHAAAAVKMSELAAADPRLTTMMSVVKTSGLLDIPAEPAPQPLSYTVFAVDNSGFAAFEDANLKRTWLTNQQEALRLLARLIVVGVHKVSSDVYMY
jgi:uncharacterized surface protein with fasciclin (FAS1) repeats